MRLSRALRRPLGILLALGATSRTRRPRAPKASPGSSAWDEPGWFEESCADLLRSQGWVAHRRGGSGDQGVDVFAQKDGIRVALQCKYWTGPVGNGAVQEVLAGCYHTAADIAAVVTNATYTPSARDLAATTGVRLMTLDDLRRADAYFGMRPAPERRSIRHCPACDQALRLPVMRIGTAKCPRCALSAWFST